MNLQKLVAFGLTSNMGKLRIGEDIRDGFDIACNANCWCSSRTHSLSALPLVQYTDIVVECVVYLETMTIDC